MIETERAAAIADQLLASEADIRHALAQHTALLAHLDTQGAHADLGYGTLDALLVDVLHLSRGDARRRINRARLLHPQLEDSTIRPAVAPWTQKAFTAGAIGVEHVDEIIKTLAELPATLPAVEREETEKALVRLARTADPKAVKKAGITAIAMAGTDGVEPKVSKKELTEPERELRLNWRRDGRLAFTGTLDAEAGVLFQTLLSPLSKPRPADDGELDERSPAQRAGDGFADLLERVQRSTEMPSEAGERPTIIVTMTLADLVVPGQTRLEGDRIVLNDGTPITAGQARRMACDAGIIPAVLGGESELLDLGRMQRTASVAQRRALNLRDKGCVKCGRPAKWCQAHHLRWWERDAGPTDLDNMCLLCSECHRLMHHSEWRVVMKPNGTPECVPPGWMPTRC